MNKQEMAKAISTETGLTQVDTNKVLNTLESITIDTLAKGEKVQLTGFFIAKPAYRAPRKGYDPLKGQAMEIAETVGVKVSAGEKLKGAVKDLDVKKFAPKK